MATAIPDLSGLNSGSTPTIQPPAASGGGPSASAAPAIPAGPHAGLMALITHGLQGLGAFGTAIATHGREGGVQQVMQENAQQEQLRQNQERITQEQQDAQVRNKALTAQTNLYTLQAQKSLALLPGELQQQSNAIDKETVDLYKELGIDPLFAMQHVPGQSIEEHGSGIHDALTASGKDVSNSVVIPVQDGDHGKGGQTYGFAADKLKNVTIPMDMYGPKLAAMKTSVDGAAGILGEDNPQVQRARAIIDTLSKSSSVDALTDRQLTMVISGTLLPAVANKIQATKFQEDQSHAQEAAIKAANAATDEALGQKVKRSELAGQALSQQKTAEELKQMKGMDNLTDPFGETVGKSSTGQTLSRKEFDANQKVFNKDYVEPIQQLAKTNMEFNRILSNPKMTGAEKVTGLLGAVGISGDPLKGKGFRINNAVIDEHAQARNIWETAAQKANTIVGTGGPITEKQVRDYASIAQGVVHDAYVTAAQEARRQGLPVDFLPKGTGVVDPFTAKIYLDAAGGDVNKAHQALLSAGFK
jgi:hypothetical protein